MAGYYAVLAVLLLKHEWGIVGSVVKLSISDKNNIWIFYGFNFFMAIPLMPTLGAVFHRKKIQHVGTKTRKNNILVDLISSLRHGCANCYPIKNNLNILGLSIQEMQ